MGAGAARPGSPLSAQARARLARLRDGGSATLQPPAAEDRAAVARWRAEVHRAWLEGDPPAEACGHREDRVAGRRVLRTAPVPDGPRILYLHGGGYALGSPEVALPITERLARGAEVVSVDYRLAPEHPCPAAIDDAVAVYRAMAAAGPVPAVAGDSAGANLALSVALSAPAPEHPRPSTLILLSPHLDQRRSTARPDRDRPSDVDDRAARWLAAAYRGDLDADDPRLSPLRAGPDRIGRLPPTLIQVGSIDTSREQGVRLAERIESVGGSVALEVWDGLWHTWHYHRDLPEADRALARAVAFARHHHGLPDEPA